jgi:hypothetical protein
MPSADAPAISFNDEELARLRELRRIFLVSQGLQPHAATIWNTDHARR